MSTGYANALAQQPAQRPRTLSSHSRSKPQHRAADFADDRPGAYFVSATGRWLDSPVAVLKATSGGRAVSALVSLAEPHYDAASQTLTFKVRGPSV